jgi:hypothetical protein
MRVFIAVLDEFPMSYEVRFNLNTAVEGVNGDGSI